MRHLIFLVFLFGLCIGCDKEDDSQHGDNLVFLDATVCGSGIYFGGNLFNTAPSDEYYNLQASIEGDCLVGLLQYGGGCGGANFIYVAQIKDPDNPGILESRISLDDNDSCEALPVFDFSYELIGLQVDGLNEIIISVEGLEEDLIYKY